MSLQSPIDMDTLDEGRIALLAVDMQRLVRTVQECAEGFATVPEDHKVRQGVRVVRRENTSVG